MKIRESHLSSSVPEPARMYVASHYPYHHHENAEVGRLRAAEFDRLLFAPIRRSLRAVAARVRAYFCERGTITALSRLSDGTLKDIGLHRSEIRRAAREATAEMAVERKSVPPVALIAPARAVADDCRAARHRMRSRQTAERAGTRAMCR